MAMGDPNAPDVNERKKSMALPRRKPNQKSMAMPTVMPIPMAIRRSPEDLMARDLANETSSAMKGANYNETPAAPLRDRAMAIPTGKEQSMNMRATPKQTGPTGPREYATFGEFLKTMGLGK